MAGNYINAVYYPSWRIYRGFPPSSLRLDCISHIFYAFLRINKDGSLRSLDEWADTGITADGEKGCLAALAKLKRERPHIRTLISVGGGSGSAEFPSLAASPQARARFAAEVKEFIMRWELDGVDIDWEHPTTSHQGSDYLSLLQDLRAALPPPCLLTSALPTGEYALKNLDLPACASLLSFINLMAYDFAGSWTGTSGHHAQLMHASSDASHKKTVAQKCATGGVEYLLRHGVPSQQIVLGVPAYARSFRQATGPGQAFQGACEIDYCDLDGEYVRNAVVDRVLGAASHVDQTGCADTNGQMQDPKGFISFDVPETVRMKARYVQAMRLAGLFYWTGVADRSGDESLVAAGFQELATC